MNFAHELKKIWEIESLKSRFSEVQQFRALMRSFALLRGNFDIEEFHGMKHQVIFNGKGNWGRTPARCEISDLLIVSFCTKPTFKARATLLQAKKSDDKHGDLCSTYPKASYPTNFKANLEQWDLLSRRPRVLPFPPFECHSEILSGAILSSIGSFGVFHKNIHGTPDLFYMSADIANPLTNPKRKHAKIEIKHVDATRNVNGYTERVFACCIGTFGEALYRLEIGTPIENAGTINNKDAQYRELFRGWLKGILRSHLEMTSSNSVLARELLDYLPSEEAEPFFHDPPSMLLIKT